MFEGVGVRYLRYSPFNSLFPGVLDIGQYGDGG